MSTISSLWKKFAKNKVYRRAYVGSYLKRSIPFQIASMRKARGWSQKKLAKAAGLTQGVISRAENPNYGNLTFNTILHIAAGLDVAFIGQFVPFSELAKRADALSEESAEIPAFTKDVEPLNEEKNVPAFRFVKLVMQPGSGKSVAALNYRPFFRKRDEGSQRIPTSVTNQQVGTEKHFPKSLGPAPVSHETLRALRITVAGGVFPAANSSASGSLKNPLVEAHF